LEIIRRQKIPGEQTYEPTIRSTAFPTEVYLPKVSEVEQEKPKLIELSTILGVEGEEGKENKEEVKMPLLDVDNLQGDGMIRFECECGKSVKVKKKYAGRTGKCPRCKRRLDIPDSSTR
jgi:hypothetical protein